MRGQDRLQLRLKRRIEGGTSPPQYQIIRPIFPFISSVKNKKIWLKQATGGKGEIKQAVRKLSTLAQ